MKFLTSPAMPTLAVADGATTPVPAGGNGSLIWSSTASCMMYWDRGVSWRPIGALQPSTEYIKAPAPVSFSATATMTIANLLNGLLQYTGGVAGTLTLPTGTLTDAGVIASMPVDLAFDWVLINTGAGVATIGAGTAHTIVGSATVAAAASARFRTRKTAASTFVTYRIS